MHAKISPQGLRFFAHDIADPSCPCRGESQAHLYLKTLFARLSREAGWHAEVEVPGQGWRADTLATHPSTGRKVAWEVQLSPANLATLQRRTETLARDRVAVCWICDRLRHWLGLFPSIQIESVGPWPFESVRPQSPGVVPAVLDGHRRYDTATRTWENPGPLELNVFVTAVLTGNLINIAVPQHSNLYFPSVYGPSRRPGTRVWTTPAYAAQFHQHRATR
ncbi:hypothetical protein MTP10_40860 [Nonomuraea sp. 3-1Str]|uniref:competence protein CoiA family protein n=1 Tax=Nonomuraea sp. 3-1Str TaxID=2929801 RepID=UPI002859B09C|nr:hypothetical protein [Nonomuraea sp. 3-1Str]MDR8415069.1 hypothetical protein [Nonomuraea sp. 3-1Str]